MTRRKNNPSRVNILILVISLICFFYGFAIPVFAGQPAGKKYFKTGVDNIFNEGSCVSLFTDITFYGGKPVNGYGISFEPCINDFLSLNYKFALNYRGSEEFSVHGNPGTVVAPFWLSEITPDDTNKTGKIVLAVISLLIPEGVNFKYQPAGFSKIIVAGYLNPIGVDYARRRPDMDRTIYMSGELGAKVYFAVRYNIYVSTFGGVRSVYSFGKAGFTVGVNAGMILGGTPATKIGKKDVGPVFYEN